MQRPKPIHHSNSQNWEGPLSEPVRKKKKILLNQTAHIKLLMSFFVKSISRKNFIDHQFLRVKIFLFPLARKLVCKRFYFIINTYTFNFIKIRSKKFGPFFFLSEFLQGTSLGKSSEYLR